MNLSYRAKTRLFVPLGGIAGAILGSLLGIAFLPEIATLLAMAGAVLGVLVAGLYYATQEAATREREQEEYERERERERERNRTTREETEAPGEGNRD